MMISIFWFFKNSNSNFILCLKSGNVVRVFGSPALDLDHVILKYRGVIAYCGLTSSETWECVTKCDKVTSCHKM